MTTAKPPVPPQDYLQKWDAQIVEAHQRIAKLERACKLALPFLSGQRIFLNKVRDLHRENALSALREALGEN